MGQTPIIGILFQRLNYPLGLVVIARPIQSVSTLKSQLRLVLIPIDGDKGSLVLISLKQEEELRAQGIGIIRKNPKDYKVIVRALWRDSNQEILLSQVLMAFTKWPPSIWEQSDEKSFLARSASGTGLFCATPALTLPLYTVFWDFVVVVGGGI